MQQHEEMLRGDQAPSPGAFVDAEKVKEIRVMTGLNRSAVLAPIRPMVYYFP